MSLPPSLSALVLPEHNPPGIIEGLFNGNQWSGSWRNGVYGFHHHHSTTHEVQGVLSGTARVQFGGEGAITLPVSRGDVVIIPAGVAHKNVGASQDFRVVGAYSLGQSWDMCSGKPGERSRADQNVARVALPESDPVYGTKGSLMDYGLKGDS